MKKENEKTLVDDIMWDAIEKGKRFKEELKDGARVVIFADSLNFWKPQQVITFPDKSKLFFYIKGSKETK